MSAAFWTPVREQYTDYVFSECTAWVTIAFKRSSVQLSWQSYPAWSGFCPASDVNKLDQFLNRYKRLNYCNQTTPYITEQFDKADKFLFQTVRSDSHHVLHHFLPAIKHQRYKLRPWAHSFTLTCKSSFHDNCNFVTNMLFRDAYWLL